VRPAAAGAVALAITVAAACGPKPPPGGVTRNDAIVKITSNVGDASLFVDGRFVGPIGVLRGGVAVEPGVHRFELRHEDYFSRYLELDLQRAERRELKVELAPVLP
jgi:hypothetical protein